MADLLFSSENFSSTEVTVEPASVYGRVLFREFFGEACSVTLRKSRGVFNSDDK